MLRRLLKNDDFIISNKPSTEQEQEDPIVVLLPEKPVDQKIIGNDARDLKSLERAVLGGETEFSEKLDEWRAGTLESPSTSSDDEGPAEVSIKRNEERQKSKNSSSADRKPAWIDEDDEQELAIPKNSRKYAQITSYDADEIKNGQHYSKKLRAQYEKCVAATPSWADVSNKTKKRRKNYSDSDDEDSDEDDLLKRTGNYIGKSINLPRNTLEFKKLCDVTASNKIKAVINTTEFHKQARVLLVSGYTQRIMLFQVDGDENPLLHSIKFDGFPIETSHFSADGETVCVGSSMHTYFYVYDMHANKITKIPPIRCLNQQKMGKFVVSPDERTVAFVGVNGTVNLLAAKTYDFIGTLKMNGRVDAMCFSTTGDTLYSHGDDGQVYIWDVNSRQCVHKFTDDGCIKGTAINVSNDDRYLACGSNTGVVNFYDSNSIISNTTPTPIKSIMNLTTPINTVRFNGNGEILASSSSSKDNALRMFHVSSRSTFKNFPHEGAKLNKLQSLDFSPNNGYFCCGTDKGQALLYRLFHYESY